MMALAIDVLVIGSAYLLGAIPVSYLVVRAVKGVDLRQEGSGNLGATNVVRTVGWSWGLITLLCDVMKGYLAVQFVPQLMSFAPTFLPGDLLAVFCGSAAVLGHIWPVFLKFSGGKGVATSLGVFAALNSAVTLATVGVALLVIATTRYVSLGSLLAALVLPCLMWAWDSSQAHLILSLVVSAVVVRRHRENVRRLVLGQENRLHFSSKHSQKDV